MHRLERGLGGALAAVVGQAAHVLLDGVGLLAGARQRLPALEAEVGRARGRASPRAVAPAAGAGAAASKLGSAKITPPPCGRVLTPSRSRSRPEVRYVNV